MSNLNSTKTVLLYSRGLDSEALRYVLKPEVLLYVDLQTSYSAVERSRLPASATVVEFPGLLQFERQDKIIPLRNMFLIAIASHFGTQIALGATAGDRVLDKSTEFAKQMSTICSMLWNDYWCDEPKTIVVTLPFKHLTKAQIVAEYIAAGGDAERLARESLSCYQPDYFGEPCGLCKPCVRKWVAFKVNGISIQPSSEGFIRRTMLPAIRAGTFNRPAEFKDILIALNEEVE